MAYSDDNPYNKELEDNKAAYNDMKISRDQYDKRARTIRRKARDWEKRKGDPQGTAPKRTRRKSSTRKKKALTNIDHEALKEELKTLFADLDRHDLKLGESCHAITWPAIVQAKMAEPEKNAGQAILDKFKARWLQEPKWWTVYMQGNVEVYALGPIVEVKS